MLIPFSFSRRVTFPGELCKFSTLINVKHPELANITDRISCTWFIKERHLFNSEQCFSSQHFRIANELGVRWSNFEQVYLKAVD